MEATIDMWALGFWVPVELSGLTGPWRFLERQGTLLAWAALIPVAGSSRTCAKTAAINCGGSAKSA